MSQRTFHYIEESPSTWPKCMENLKAASNEKLTVLVPWGAHETTQGVRDFSRGSKLRLEKVLALAAEKGLSVDLKIGFENSINAFPQWTMGLTSKTLVPSGAWNSSEEGFFLLGLPSLLDTTMREGFISFISEVLSIANLYAAPEGPVERLCIDLSYLEMDQGLLNHPSFFAELKKRYLTVETVNSRYNTNFKTIDSLCTRQGFKSLFEKRPWLASYDYRFCREQLLKQLRAELLSLSLETLQIHLQEESQENIPHTEKVFTMDPLLFEEGKGSVFPFLPDGQMNAMNAFAYRIVEYQKEKTEQAGLVFKSLPIFQATDALICNFLVVTSGKYMTGASLKSIERVWMRGGQVLFPFGLPQFDENMTPIDWLGDGEKKIGSIDGVPFSIYERGLGKIWVPVQLVTATDRSFNQIIELVSKIERAKSA